MSATGISTSSSPSIPAMELEQGRAVEIMRSVKRSLDPLDLVNPGKVIPDAPDKANSQRFP